MPRGTTVKKPEPLKPHYEDGVSIVRIPAGTPGADKNKALHALRALAKKFDSQYAWFA